MPDAWAMTIANGRIAAIGREEDLPEEKGTVIDLKGRRVIPGFVDAHMHPVIYADFRKQITVMPPDICSIEEMIQAIRRRRQAQERDSGLKAGDMMSRAFRRNVLPIDMIWTGDAMTLRYP